MLIIYGFVTWLRIRQVKNHREELIIQFDKSSKFLKYIQREIYVFSHLSSCSCMYAPKMAWVEIQSNSFEGGKNEKWTKMSIFGVTFLWSVFYTRVRHKIFSTLNDGQFLTEKKNTWLKINEQRKILVYTYIFDSFFYLSFQEVINFHQKSIQDRVVSNFEIISIFYTRESYTQYYTYYLCFVYLTYLSYLGYLTFKSAVVKLSAKPSDWCRVRLKNYCSATWKSLQNL